MHTQTLVLRFPDATTAEASRGAESLRESILDRVPEVKVELSRSNEAAMNSGDILTIVLGSPAIIALARAIHSWCVRNNATGFELVTDRGSITVKSARSEDVAGIVDALSRCLNSKAAESAGEITSGPDIPSVQ